jgi:hypothetical protein
VGGFFGMILAKILDLFDAVRDLFVNLATDFKESNRFFKVKVGLIVGYIAICLATVFVFIPPGELNEVGARLRVSKTEIVGGRYFLVVNESSDIWRSLVLTMNNQFTARYPALRPGKKKAFFYTKFKDSRGAKPSEDVYLRTFRLDCSAGAFERDFTRNN